MITLPNPSVIADVDDYPKYCKYHRVIHHETAKCFTVKNII